MAKKHKHIDCIVVGDMDVGKTSVQTSFVEQWTHTPFYRPYSFNGYETDVIVKDANGDDVVINVFDTQGHHDYERLRALVYPKAKLFILCFSLVHPGSYKNIYSRWLSELQHHCPHVPVLLVGTKRDLLNSGVERRNLRKSNTAPLTYNDGVEMCTELGFVKYFECSAATGSGLHEIFSEVAKFATLPSCNENEKTNVSMFSRILKY